MTLKDAIKKAVRERDAQAALSIAEHCRSSGMNYDGTYAWVRKHTDIALPEWDALLYEAETVDET